MNKFFVAIGALLLCVSAWASPAGTIPAEASGHWRSNQAIGTELVVVVGKYFANGGGMTTCGSVLRVDAGVATPTTTLYGKGTYYDPSAAPVPEYTSVTLLRKFAVTGRVRVNWYDFITDTLNVTIAGSQGANGTFTFYRDLLTPRVAVVNPC